jgi:hypothetical protein
MVIRSTDELIAFQLQASDNVVSMRWENIRYTTTGKPVISDMVIVNVNPLIWMHCIGRRKWIDSKRR